MKSTTISKVWPFPNGRLVLPTEHFESSSTFSKLLFFVVLLDRSVNDGQAGWPHQRQCTHIHIKSTDHKKNNTLNDWNFRARTKTHISFNVYNFLTLIVVLPFSTKHNMSMCDFLFQYCYVITIWFVRQDFRLLTVCVPIYQFIARENVVLEIFHLKCDWTIVCECFECLFVRKYTILWIFRIRTIIAQLNWFKKLNKTCYSYVPMLIILYSYVKIGFESKV